MFQIKDLKNWTSGNTKIDSFIQKRQLKAKNYNDVIFEWIPYDQFSEIKETDKNGSITVYSAIWRNGPLYKKNKWTSYYIRDPNKEVSLKILHNLQNPVDSLINKAKKYSTKTNEFFVLYGISQNPDTSDYILVQNYLIRTSGNEKIDDFIQERNINLCDGTIFEWIPYNQFNKIKETGKSGSITIYSAIWRNGILHKCNGKYTRISNEEVALKSKKYSTKKDKFLRLYGISQNPDTSDYILVQNHLIRTSGNEKIDDFIQERQLKANHNNDVIFEWIPYNQFNEIKEICKNSSITVYSAIWWNGPLYHFWKSYYSRDSNKEVVLKCLHNLQNPVDSLINEAKKHSTKNDKFLVLYEITQNPDTGYYILVQNDNTVNLINWISGNEKIDNFIIERQLNINPYDDVTFEWIPYNQFNRIKEISKNSSITTYSAIWRNGPLYKKNKWTSYYERYSNIDVTLKCLHNLQNPVDSLINEAKKYSTKNNKFLVLYGISQNPDTKDYILALDNEKYCSMCDEIYSDIQYKWCKLCNFMCWKSGDVKIDSLIQLKINKPSDTRFKWISYNQFNKIRNIDKGHFVTVHSAIWKYEETEVALVCFNDSQKFLNKVKEHANSFKMYGISQNPKKKNYILVLENEYCTEYGKTYCKNCGEKYGHADHSWCRQCLITATSINNGNEKIDDLIQEMQLKINSPFNIIFEWIPYDQFNYIKEIGKGGFATVYSAIWKDGPIKYDVDEEMCTRVSNKKVALKCLNNSQNMIDKFLSEV
ncbi:hypothetical protein RirG_140450 [Rhizophagus irregularis DAOM 197198w]|uniref:Protein kinase domain-containing protein n=1 Tax=Rhizophagus irregularis (strain DAOM 197198w) TaxID=1432141 RepID=A0A015JCM7_RHIIW|nr:hypothetical protein RirG_140450 [Rhizophagus irregularis DAOM 197198w]